MFPERGRVIGPAAFLFVAIVLGGSIQSPLFVLIVQLAAIALLGVSITTLRTEQLPAGAPLALGFAVVLVLVPLLQLVPLPSHLWSSLAGHAFPADILSAAGLPPAARPLSLAPDQTWRALLALTPPIAMFVATLTLSSDERRTLALVVGIAATLSALLGVLQVMGTSAYLYDYVHRGNATGVFANRNHEADLMLVAAVLVAAYGAAARGRATMRPLAGAFVALFLISAVATTSRAGTALMPLAGAAAIYLLASAGGKKPRRTLVGGGVAIAVIAGAIATFSPLVQTVLARYHEGSEDRREFRAATRYAIGQYWPTGSGLGSFEPVYRSVEDLDTMSSLVVNHAHDEYLELALELGLLAPAMIAAFLALAITRLAKKSSSTRATALRLAGATCVTLLLLHSFLDYPLRMPGLAAIFGFCCALLYLPRDAERPGRRSVSARHDVAGALG